MIGDRYGTSCVGVVAETVDQTLRALGYTVSRNKPYAGGFITEHYGNPAADCMPSSSRSTVAFTWTSAVISVPRHSIAWQRIWRRWPGVWAKFRWNSCGRTGPLPNSWACTKKGAASGCERPKSREETPKEGSGSARYRTAIGYTAVHKNQGSKAYFLCYICMAGARVGRNRHVCAKMTRSEPRDTAKTRPVRLDNLPIPGRGFLRRAVATKPSLQ